MVSAKHPEASIAGSQSLLSALAALFPPGCSYYVFSIQFSDKGFFIHNKLIHYYPKEKQAYLKYLKCKFYCDLWQYEHR